MNGAELRSLVKAAAFNARRKVELKLAIKQACDMRKQAGLGSYITNGAKSLWSLGKGIGGAWLNGMTFGLAGADPAKHFRESFQHSGNAFRGLVGMQQRPVGAQPRRPQGANAQPMNNAVNNQKMLQAQQMKANQIQAQKAQMQSQQMKAPQMRAPVQPQRQAAMAANERQAKILARAGM